MNIHAAVILLAVTLGSTLFGIIGAFLAVPFVAVGAVIYRYVDEQLVVRGGGQAPPETPPTGSDGSEDPESAADSEDAAEVEGTERP